MMKAAFYRVRLNELLDGATKSDSSGDLYRFKSTFGHSLQIYFWQGQGE
jgi:hypothetical protein